MSNRDTEAALAYHEATKLSYINLNNKPRLYKSYAGLPAIPLPQSDLASTVPALDALTSHMAVAESSLDLPGLARILYLSAGLIRKAVLPVAGEVHYRAAASAGALYPVEIYLVCGEVPGLAAGVYHFSPAEFSLVRLREGDYRGTLADTLADPAVAASIPASLVLSTNFWRSAWKYRVRSYRYCYWDAGTILANLLAVASANGMAAQVVAGFLDQEVNHLLGLDSEEEAAVCVIPLGVPQANPILPPSYPSDSLGQATACADIIEVEIEYPEIQEIHRASSLEHRGEVVDWGKDWNPAPPGPALSSGPYRALDPSRDGNTQSLGGGPLVEAILQRGSTRRFARESIPLAKFSAVLTSATTPVAADFLPPGQPSLLETYLIANGVEGLEPGSYRYSPGQSSLELLRQGNLRHEAGHLCFEQALGADASTVFFFMADLDQVLSRWGNRGYRAAQLEAGILGGRVYLAAHALGLGASGMTFYDEDVSEFFATDQVPRSGNQADRRPRKSLMFLVALGLTHQTNRVRPFRSRVGILLDSLARGAGGGPVNSNA